MSSKFSLIANKAFKKINKLMGEPIIYEYQNGVIVSLCAVFYVRDADVEVGGNLHINSVDYEFTINKYDIQQKPTQGDLITARNSTFEVVDVQNKGLVNYVLRCHSVDIRNTTEYDIF